MAGVVDVEAKSWACGCFQCSYGIVTGPPLERSTAAYHARLGAFLANGLEFCNCKAGVMYRTYLRNLYQRFVEEARRDPKMAEFARMGTHPELEGARRTYEAWRDSDEANRLGGEHDGVPARRVG